MGLSLEGVQTYCEQRAHLVAPALFPFTSTSSKLNLGSILAQSTMHIGVRAPKSKVFLIKVHILAVQKAAEVSGCFRVPSRVLFRSAMPYRVFRAVSYVRLWQGILKVHGRSIASLCAPGGIWACDPTFFPVDSEDSNRFHTLNLIQSETWID